MISPACFPFSVLCRLPVLRFPLFIFLPGILYVVTPTLLCRALESSLLSNPDSPLTIDDNKIDDEKVISLLTIISSLKWHYVVIVHQD